VIAQGAVRRVDWVARRQEVIDEAIVDGIRGGDGGGVSRGA
jgi:hypothetical protein